jgi:hypothetical protein
MKHQFLSVQVEPEMLRRLKEIAHSKRVTVSDVVRRLIADFFENIDEQERQKQAEAANFQYESTHKVGADPRRRKVGADPRRRKNEIADLREAVRLLEARMNELQETVQGEPMPERAEENKVMSTPRLQGIDINTLKNFIDKGEVTEEEAAKQLGISRPQLVRRLEALERKAVLGEPAKGGR